MQVFCLRKFFQIYFFKGYLYVNLCIFIFYMESYLYKYICWEFCGINIFFFIRVICFLIGKIGNIELNNLQCKVFYIINDKLVYFLNVIFFMQQNDIICVYIFFFLLSKNVIYLLIFQFVRNIYLFGKYVINIMLKLIEIKFICVF